MVKCRRKAPIMQVLLHTSMFIVQLSKRYLKNPFQTISFKRTHVWHGACKISFKCSIDQLLEYRDLTQFIAAKLLTNFTFALQRIPEWQFLIIFCYTELLLPRHSESDRTLISFRISRYRISHSSQLLEYRDLTTVIAAKLLTNYTFVLWRISVISNHSLLYRIAKEPEM